MVGVCPFAVQITPSAGEAYTAKLFATFVEARDYCRHSISYTGDRIQRVEIEDLQNGGTRAMWDLGWDSASKYAGLWSG